MSQINISELTFSYESSYENIFEEVSFQIDTRWKLGFIGRNGRGKTTFMKLLMKEYEYSGRISTSVEFEYFPYTIKNPKEMTLEVVKEIDRHFEEWELLRELSLLRVSEDVLYRSFETLSKGEQTKVLLATLFLKPNHFLLIDEPTNHLDVQGREILKNYLKRKKGFIVVSHDRKFLDGCIDHVLAINKMDIEVQKGNFTSWIKNKEGQDQFEINENKKLKKEIKSLNQAAKRTANWSDKIEKTKNGQRVSGLRPDRGYIGHQAARMMKRSKAIEGRQNKAIEEKSKLLKNIEEAEALKFQALEFKKSLWIEGINISIEYEGKKVIEGLSFSVNKGDRLSIKGKNGSGKSSILKLLIEENNLNHGSLEISSNLKISYIPQDTSFLKGDLKNYTRENNIDESLFKAILRKLDFSRIQFEKDIKEFSEGQKKKVLLARSLCEKAHLYLWDEPLNFVDVMSRIQIEEMILREKPTMIFVEHDEAFCESIGNKILEL